MTSKTKKYNPQLTAYIKDAIKRAAASEPPEHKECLEKFGYLFHSSIVGARVIIRNLDNIVLEPHPIKGTIIIPLGGPEKGHRFCIEDSLHTIEKTIDTEQSYCPQMIPYYPEDHYNPTSGAISTLTL